MRLLDILTFPWAIEPSKLEEIRALYLAHMRGPKIDWRGIQEKIQAAQTEYEQKKQNEPEKGYLNEDGVAVVNVSGVLTKTMTPSSWFLGGASMEDIGTAFVNALDDYAVKSILLRIDSPGGTVDGTQNLSDLIYSSRGKKPIIAYSDGSITSGAYWIGSAADKVYISGDTVHVGNIGILATHIDRSKSDELAGEKYTEITSGKYKRMVSGHSPLSKDGRQYLQDTVDYLYSAFISDIARNRGISIDRMLEKADDARTFIGKQAVDNGLVDGVATYDQLIRKLGSVDSYPAIRAGAGNQSMEVINMAELSFEASLSHNSTTADSEPDWGSVDKTKLPRNAHADEGEAGKKSTWGYPHHWVKNGGDLDENGVYTTGDMYLHAGGLNAAWAAAQGARSGQKASSSVISHLSGHRKALGLEEKQSENQEVIMNAEELKEKHPQLYQQVVDEAIKMGAEKERERIIAVRAALIPGHEKINDDAIADGKSSAGDVALRIVAAEKVAREAKLAALEADSKEAGKVPGAAAPVNDKPQAEAGNAKEAGDKLDKIAQAIKAEKKCSYAEALAQAEKDNPKLAAAYSMKKEG